ncbi:PcfK-like family protein, partial [Bacteroides thetaiotaomicron]|uniref:PcfK-like family protein n=1 Tax=Bacteroides thetaiotaomicron TaxID=818 RepID=UPI0039C89CD3
GWHLRLLLKLSKVITQSKPYNTLIIRITYMVTLDFYILGIIVVIESFDNHYYDEDNIDVGKPISCGVVVNHKVELTEEEKAQARKDALKAYQEEEMRKIQQRHSRPKPTAKAVQNTQTELSLFDF